MNRRAPDDFGIVEFSVQSDHVHLLIEAVDRQALSSGLRSFVIRVAKRVNALLFRVGPLWADRWHESALKSPRAVRAALIYVFSNHRKHVPTRSALDPFSSAPFFTGFAEYAGTCPVFVNPSMVPRALAPPVQGNIKSRTWLLRTGWTKAGRISVESLPRGRNATRA